MDAVAADRIHFAFTASYHYLFPQLTMGLALLIVILKTAALRTGDAHYDEAARTGLEMALVWWLPGMLLAIVYALYVYRRLRGKVRLEAVRT